MSTTFVEDKIWPEITAAVGAAKGPCHVAVAYLGRQGHRLLPLRRNSNLVERPNYQNRRRVKVFARRLGNGAQKQLRRTGLIRDPIFAASLLKAWHSA
jgi:hypothetical protein